MASTRNRNMPGDYADEKRRDSDWATYVLNPAKRVSDTPQLPGNGLLPGQMPWTQLSGNAVDTESFLLGIGSTNLEDPTFVRTFKPQPLSFGMAHVFPLGPSFVPAPLVVERNQRPYLWYGEPPLPLTP